MCLEGDFDFSPVAMQQSYALGEKYIASGLVAYSLKSNTGINNISDFRGKKIGVGHHLLGSSYHLGFEVTFSSRKCSASTNLRASDAHRAPSSVLGGYCPGSFQIVLSFFSRSCALSSDSAPIRLYSTEPTLRDSSKTFCQARSTSAFSRAAGWRKINLKV